MTDDYLTMLQDSVAAFTRPYRGKTAGHRAARHAFDPEAWRVIAEQGWLAILVPESLGGLGLGVAPVAVVAREFGRAAYREPFVAGVMASLCLSAADEPERWQDRLSALIEGRLTVALAWQNARGDFDIGAAEIWARREGAGLRLNGFSRFVAGPDADAFIVSVRFGSTVALYWLDRDVSGLSVGYEACADGTSFATLRLEDVRVDQTALLIGEDSAGGVLNDAIDIGLVAISAELVGVMDTALAMTLDYMRTREQFGAPIGSFQVLQHRAVDVWMQRQLSAAAVTAAARALDDPTLSRVQKSTAASGAKARAAQAALLLCNQALQLHGAMWFTEEYGLGLYINRALTLSAWLGNAAQHRRRFGLLTIDHTGRAAS